MSQKDYSLEQNKGRKGEMGGRIFRGRRTTARLSKEDVTKARPLLSSLFAVVQSIAARLVELQALKPFIEIQGGFCRPQEEVAVRS